MTLVLTPGARVRFTFHGGEFEGTYVTEREGRMVIKLENGYNLGVEPAALLSSHLPPPSPPPRITTIEQDSSLPECAIISTGGTIASRVDYRTGAVTSQFSAEDILRAIPGLGGIARYRTRQISSLLSENMQPGIWRDLAHAIYHEICEGVRGVIVTHGTDTMGYTASAMAFMIETTVPVVFVGSQRSADRPSSDNVMNALCSARAAVSELGEAAVVMHGTTSDDHCAIHRATRVRKMHTSRRDAFQSIGIPPLGGVEYPDLTLTLGPHARTRQEGEARLFDRIEERCGLLTFVPGTPPEVIDSCEGYQGLVIAGSGLGHVASAWVPRLKELIGAGTTVVMTSQCLHGRVCDRVYDTGRDLLSIGVIEGEDMLPETAVVKLGWVLGHEQDPERVRTLMQTDLRGEICRRSLHGL
ncbi:MAG: Glu-tRNA(Gln) amidotransferase subunit GatD [Methanomicrobiales archaeon]|nr:Glu-tRNA(Gln) amidotransferase subunit GatD [Methanomicrobiales archaeon]